MADTDKRLTKVERLQAGGYVAPKLRKAKDDAAKGTKPQRRVAVVDKEGRVVGYRDLVDITKKLAERAQIEFDVQPGARPKTVLCEVCNSVVKVRYRSKVPKKCWGGCRVPCSGGCGKIAPSYAFTPKAVRQRRGLPWRCGPCAQAELAASGHHREACKVAAKKTTRQRAARARKAWEAMTPSQRSGFSRAGVLARRARKVPTPPSSSAPAEE